jgi:hypothetical protein
MKDDFLRMLSQDCSGLKHKTFEEFNTWNIMCLINMTEEELTWTMELCNRLKNQKIKLMDMEPCSVFIAESIYFDGNQNLCIVNGR